MAWKLVLSGRFRLLNQWCTFFERHNISEDTWKQVLAFSRCVQGNIEGYDPDGAWPVLIDEFVNHLYNILNLICECRDPEAQLIYEPKTGTKRKLNEDSQGQGFKPMDTFMISKRRHTDLADNDRGYQQIISMGFSKPLCAIEGGLSKGFAELFSGRSCLHFDHETIVLYT